MEIIKKKKRNDVHPYIPELEELYRGGRITRREFLRNAALLGMSLASAGTFLAACAQGTPAPTKAPATEAPAEAPTEVPPTAMPVSEVKRGGILRSEYGWIPYMEDPATDGVGTGNVGRNVAETLTWVDDDNVPHPLLCERWEPSEDAKEWTLYLQRGVTFNNDKPFNADDVMWNFQHWLDPDVGAGMGGKLSMLSSTGVEKVDDYTVKLHLDRPFYGIPWLLYDYPGLIAPAGGWDDFYHGDAEHAIGTGPFLMKEFVPDERMELVRREDYWQNGVDGRPLPYLDGVRVSTGFDDASKLAAILGDELDMVGTVGEGIVEELQRHEGIVVALIDKPWSSPIELRCDMAPFDDPRVRNALKWCQDRESLRARCMPKGRLAWDHWVHPLHEGWCSDTDKDRPQDIEKAKALLAEAGYPDGIEIDLVTPNTPEHRPAFAQALKEMAAPAGITINVKLMPSSAFWDQVEEWPVKVSGWGGRPLATDVLDLVLRCGAPYPELHYCNEEFDRLVDEVEGAVDVEKRRQLLCKVQRMMQEDCGLLLPFWNIDYYAYRQPVRGYSYAAMQYGPVWLA
jgi:peptide/nickel transport system substrate-binding protein